MKGVLNGKLMVTPCACPKPQGASGNGAVVFGIDANGFEEVKGGLVGPTDGIPKMDCDVPNALLVGILGMEATLWEVEDLMMLNRIDVNSEAVAEKVLEMTGC